MARKRNIMLLLLSLFIFGCLLTSFQLAAQEDELAKRVARIAQKAESGSISQVWDISRELTALGENAVMPLAQLLPDASVKVRLAIDAALLKLGSVKTAKEDVLSLINNAQAQTEVRLAAVELIEKHASTQDVQNLFDKLNSFTEPLVKIAVCKLAYRKVKDVNATRTLKEFLTSDDFNVGAAAAIVLAQLDDFEDTREILKLIAEEPSERGALARSLLDQDRLYHEAAVAAGLTRDELVKQKEKRIGELTVEIDRLKKEYEKATKTDIKLLDEILDRIGRFYVDEKKTDSKALIDAAAKGMVSSLDRYSSYMDERETKLFYESMKQEYSGIGARVSKRIDEYLMIESPIYSGPAYRAGLRSGDLITEVDGVDILRLSLEEVVDKLKRKENTKVKIKVRRLTWPEEREFEIICEKINLPSTRYTMLPGDIGYLALAGFQEESSDEVEAALVKLESQGMKALILDLRNNPGGLLDAAVDVADKFLPGEKLIVSSKGRDPFIAKEQKYYSKDRGTHPDHPLIILVNRGSASASEIVSGALQEHKRGLVIGETTFGKGSVQQLFEVMATEGATRLRLTIAKYYLPSGRSIHREEGSKEGGVKPDIEVKEKELIPPWEMDAAQELEKKEAFAQYLNKYYNDNKELFQKLAWNDYLDEKRYPHFDEWYNSLQTKLDRKYVRVLLRRELVKKVADELQREPVCDIAEDNALHRAIIEALAKLGKKPDEFEDYKHFSAAAEK
jgi:carboxyl-terminal processing protease